MRVIGIDPGYDRLGVAILEFENGKESLLFSTCIETDKKLNLNERLFTIGNQLTKIIKEYQPDTLAIETIFFNQNQKTAIGVAEARGLIIYLAQQNNCQVYEFGPQEIKIAVTGYGKSDKSAVIDMVKRLVINVPETALDDEYDAIAVSITCLAQYGRSR
ncbi:crossover junction endodeoxyribonuclease RuvC [Candidatus Kaiserbacteria bacterium]|nr:crossover junction endodeoxyribonuclease RuvC [Candidatus Kaiserbacteria bacterium]